MMLCLCFRGIVVSWNCVFVELSGELCFRGIVLAGNLLATNHLLVRFYYYAFLCLTYFELYTYLPYRTSYIPTVLYLQCGVDFCKTVIAIAITLQK